MCCQAKQMREDFPEAEVGGGGGVGGPGKVGHVGGGTGLNGLCLQDRSLKSHCFTTEKVILGSHRHFQAH